MLIWGALAAITLIRLIAAAIVPLAPDEAYYRIWSQALASGYVDHPPMVALWIWAGTALAGSNELGVRLFGPISAALGSCLLYDAAKRLFPGRRAGLTAAALLNATLFLGAGATIMTPDTPLLFFWTGTLWAAARIATGGAPAWWFAAGAFCGLALLSKYTAAFLPMGLGLWIAIAVPRWLRRPEPWIGAVIAAAFFLPVVLWNADHGWAGFLRQGGRVADWRPERAVGFLLELVGGQIGLATPGVFVLCAAGTVVAVRRMRDPAHGLLAALIVPPAAVFLQHAFGDRVQGNWPAILYPAASVAAAGLTMPVWRRLVWPSCALGFGLGMLATVHAATLWPSWGAADPIARQLAGWDGLAGAVEAARARAGATAVAADSYGLAAQLAWTLPRETVVLGVEPRWRQTRLPPAAPALTILVRPARRGEAVDKAIWVETVALPDVARRQDGIEIERYRLFLTRLATPLPDAVRLPAR